ncbi:MAG: hypothetical protein HOV94_12395 [Saccharothrix sp.]|nr:hypothetical protein [Saccharothrix sp.]
MAKSRHTYRRAIALLFLVLVTVVLLVGCRDSKTQTPPATTGVVPTAVATVPSAVVVKP